MNVSSTDIIVYFTLVASLGMLLGAVKMYRTDLPKLGLKHSVERDF